MNRLPDLPIACWSGCAGTGLAANAAAIRGALERAAARGARVVLTPEAALTGYPPVLGHDLGACSSCAVAEAEESLLLRAERLGVLLVLGTAGPDGAGGWTNDALAGGAAAPVRYRKRCLTPDDRRCFAPGTGPAVVAASGWRLGLAICFDLRFPDVWADLHRADVDAVLCIAHMAGPDLDPGVKPAVIPAFCAVRAAEAATPLAFCNTGAPDRWLAGGAWDARGVAQPADVDGDLAFLVLRPRTAHGPWYGALRQAYRERLPGC